MLSFSYSGDLEDGQTVGVWSLVLLGREGGHAMETLAQYGSLLCMDQRFPSLSFLCCHHYPSDPHKTALFFLLSSFFIPTPCRSITNELLLML